MTDDPMFRAGVEAAAKVVDENALFYAAPFADGREPGKINLAVASSLTFTARHIRALPSPAPLADDGEGEARAREVLAAHNQPWHHPANVIPVEHAIAAMLAFAASEAGQSQSSDVGAMREALQEISRRGRMCIHQNTGRWDMTVEHDRRSYDILRTNCEIAEAALPNSDAPPQANTPDAARCAALEEAAKVCEAEQQAFMSPQYASGQPLSSFGERFACGRCAESIRALIKGEAR